MLKRCFSRRKYSGFPNHLPLGPPRRFPDVAPGGHPVMHTNLHALLGLAKTLPPPRPDEPRFALIPYQMAGINARTVLSEAMWRRLSRTVIETHGGACTACPNDPPNRIECHEVWAYELPAGRTDKPGVMRLVGLQPLCRLCHLGKHIRFATSRGMLPEVQSHLMRLYPGLTKDRLEQLIRIATADDKLKYQYKALDLTYLNAARFAWLHAAMGRRFTANELALAAAPG